MAVETEVEERGKNHGGTAVNIIPHQLNHKNSLHGQRLASQVVCAGEIHAALSLS